MVNPNPIPGEGVAKGRRTFGIRSLTTVSGLQEHGATLFFADQDMQDLKNTWHGISEQAHALAHAAGAPVLAGAHAAPCEWKPCRWDET